MEYDTAYGKHHQVSFHLPDIMHVKNKESIEIKLQELRAENQDLKEKISNHKKALQRYEKFNKQRDLLIHSLPAGREWIRRSLCLLNFSYLWSAFL